jgi:hypothetical protein
MFIEAMMMTVQFLGIRLFNAATSSIKLALSGYYQTAFQHLRVFLESYFLVDYLRSNPAKISVWKEADKKTLIREFGPGAIRVALDERDGFKQGKRKQTYDLISSHATHPSYRGFRLTTKNMLGEIEPFFNEENLLAWLQETAKMLTHGALIFDSHFHGIEQGLLAVRQKFHQDFSAWKQKYLDRKQPSTD